MTRSLRITLLAPLLLLANPAFAQDYPNKPIRIVTSLAGDGNDFQSRLITQGITAGLGQPIIVDNRGGTTSVETVSRALPDGYTLLLYGSAIWLAPFLRDNAPWDPVRDFAPITLVEKSPNVLVVHPTLPAKSVKELLALAKAKPGDLTYSSGPSGGSSHLSGELFKALAGVNIVRVPYKSGGAALGGLMGGEVQLTFAGGGSLTPHLKSGRLRALAVTGMQPSAFVPDLPTIAAAGIPGYEAASMTAMMAPARTPTAVIQKLSREVARFIRTPEAKERFLRSGVEVVGSTPEELAATIKAEIARWGKLIKETGIKAE